MELRWTGSDKIVMDAKDLEQLADEVAAEILDEQYDGYKAKNPLLAYAIAFRLCELTESEQWYVHAETRENGRLYLVYVDR